MLGHAARTQAPLAAATRRRCPRVFITFVGYAHLRVCVEIVIAVYRWNDDALVFSIHIRGSLMLNRAMLSCERFDSVQRAYQARSARAKLEVMERAGNAHDGRGAKTQAIKCATLQICHKKPEAVPQEEGTRKARCNSDHYRDDLPQMHSFDDTRPTPEIQNACCIILCSCVGPQRYFMNEGTKTVRMHGPAAARGNAGHGDAVPQGKTWQKNISQPIHMTLSNKVTQVLAKRSPAIRKP